MNLNSSLFYRILGMGGSPKLASGETGGWRRLSAYSPLLRLWWESGGLERETGIEPATFSLGS